MKTELKQGEEVMLVTRTHYFTLALPVVVTAIALTLALIFIGTPWVWIVPLAALLWLAYRITVRNHNVWVVTNLRIIDEEGLLNVATKESPLDKINNVSYSASLAGRIFGYGDVEIQTAAETGSTIYRMVENPRRLKDTITQMQEDYKTLLSRRQAREMAETLGAHLGKNPGTGIGSELEKLTELKEKGMLSEEEFRLAKNKLLNG